MSDETETSSPRFDHRELEAFVNDVLLDVGVEDGPADVVAEALVRADLRGVSSHGVARLETYVRNFDAGGFNPRPDVTIDDVSPGIARVDADDGPGQWAGRIAMEEAMARAVSQGVGVALVHRSNHFGTAAIYTQRAAEEDFIGVSMTNVGPDVIPFGGAEAFLGTNPISVSIPTDRPFPITLDMATSVVAMGKLDHPAEEGLEIPSHWAVDASGEPTSDPEKVAALRPVGGPKGYGLGLLVDVLCSMLSGARSSPEVGALYDNFDEPMRLGHFMFAIDIESVTDPGSFRVELDRYIESLKGVPTQEDVDEILLPGEPEARTRRERERDGIPLPSGTSESLKRLADDHGVALPSPR